MRCAAIMITLGLFAAACGTPGRETLSAPPECPEGTSTLKAADVIGPVPRGYTVEPPVEDKPIDEFVGQLRKEVGEGYRSHDASVIFRRRAQQGTVVIVVNTNEGRPEDVVLGAKDAESDGKVSGERLDVDGREGRLQRAPDGAYIAMAPTGECSILILIDTTKARIKDSASLIGARS